MGMSERSFSLSFFVVGSVSLLSLALVPTCTHGDTKNQPACRFGFHCSMLCALAILPKGIGGEEDAAQTAQCWDNVNASNNRTHCSGGGGYNRTGTFTCRVVGFPLSSSCVVFSFQHCHAIATLTHDRAMAAADTILTRSFDCFTLQPFVAVWLHGWLIKPSLPSPPRDGKD